MIYDLKKVVINTTSLTNAKAKAGRLAAAGGKGPNI